MASRKDELLERLDSGALLKLAVSASESPVRSGATRAELIRIIKKSLSIEEIRKKAKLMGRNDESTQFTRNDLMAGGIGQLCLAVYGIMNSIAYYSLTIYGTISYYEGVAAWGFASSIPLLIFAILLAYSIEKMAARIGGSRIGTAAYGFALLAAATALFSYGATVLGLTLNPSYQVSGVLVSPSTMYVVLFSFYGWLLGLAMIFLGAFFLVCSEYSPSSELWIAGGIVYIVTSPTQFLVASLESITSPPVVAPIVGAICFLISKTSK